MRRAQCATSQMLLWRFKLSRIGEPGTGQGLHTAGQKEAGKLRWSKVKLLFLSKKLSNFEFNQRNLFYWQLCLDNFSQTSCHFIRNDWGGRWPYTILWTVSKPELGGLWHAFELCLAIYLKSPCSSIWQVWRYILFLLHWFQVYNYINESFHVELRCGRPRWNHFHFEAVSQGKPDGFSDWSTQARWQRVVSTMSRVRLRKNG